MSAVRVRFAPSPTGYLHVGGARTALFNWLYARHNGGVFILRVEDTDLARSTPESVDAIFEGMRWLGLNWDEGPGSLEPHGPYFQTERKIIYDRYVGKLLQAGAAYRCYRSAAELEGLRQEQAAKGLQPRYDRAWAERDPEVLQRYDAQGRPFVVRFKSPGAGSVTVNDILRGDIVFDVAEMVDDFVLIKQDGIPTYNFAAVVDDIEMGITHVIRGDDHLSNTPKQVALYEAFDAAKPLFCHLPMILGPDKSKLSKRHGTTSVMKFAQEGYLPEALLNYLVRLGWAHGDQEIFSIDEMVKLFELKELNKTAAVFDVAKLDWLNAHYLRHLDDERLLILMGRYWDAKELPWATHSPNWLKSLNRALVERSRTLLELAEHARCFFDVDIAYDPDAVAKFLDTPQRSLLNELAEELRAVSTWDEALLEQCIVQFTKSRAIKLGAVMQPLRVALTGKTTSPGMYVVLALFGKDLCFKRLSHVLSSDFSVATPANVES